MELQLQQPQRKMQTPELFFVSSVPGFPLFSVSNKISDGLQKDLCVGENPTDTAKR